MKEELLRYIEAHKEEAAKLLSEMIRCKPVNPCFDPNCSEHDVQELIKAKLESLGCEVYEIPVDFKELEAYKYLPGYMPGSSDAGSFAGRPNLLARLPGTDPQHAHSVLLSGHCDVVGAADADEWEYPPFEGIVKDGIIHGRGATDMLGGLAAALFAMEAIVKCDARPKGDIWFNSMVCEEFGGTGTLATADWMKKHNIAPDVVVMGEGTGATMISLVCRAIAFADIIVKGRAGHLERTPGDFREGDSVDAIEKARYIMDAIDRLNADWRTRKDKDHPLLHDPCQVKVSMIKGGHHPSSYAGQCVISLDIQSLPHEQNEQNLPMSVRAEVEDYLRRVCEADPWLRENPVEIVWKLDADCCEIAPDHPFVKVLQKNVQDINGGGRLSGMTFHYDGGWFGMLNGAPCVCYGPGDIFSAHRSNEICEAWQLYDCAKALAAACSEWCSQEK